ncbi:MAG: OmpH family outer membrane protein [Opitutae bacterium]|jgi:Skp family chaperone for outer membrane proteins|nr:OmpH family outer membrane protein [Opitutae bacterium]
MFTYNKIIFSLVFLFTVAISQAQKIAVVDVQKVFDGYQKVKEARERLDKSKKIAMEELEIFRAEMEKIVKELKEMEEKIKNPNIDSTALRSKYQEKVEKAKVKQEDMVSYDKRAKATIAQRQRNLLVEHLEDIRGAVKRVAAAKKFDLILNSSETQLGVFFAGEKFDVTEEVIVTLNANIGK